MQKIYERHDMQHVEGIAAFSNEDKVLYADPNFTEKFDVTFGDESSMALLNRIGVMYNNVFLKVIGIDLVGQKVYTINPSDGSAIAFTFAS